MAAAVVWQQSLWEHVTTLFRPVAQLDARLDGLAVRLGLTLERSWDQLADIDAATFCLGRTWYALSQEVQRPASGTLVWLPHGSRRSADAADPVDGLLAALSLDRTVLLRVTDPEGLWTDLTSRAVPPS